MEALDDLRWRFAQSAFAAREMFSANYGTPGLVDDEARAIKVAVKLTSEYEEVRNIKDTGATAPVVTSRKDSKGRKNAAVVEDEEKETLGTIETLLSKLPKRTEESKSMLSTIAGQANPAISTALVESSDHMGMGVSAGAVAIAGQSSGAKTLDMMLPPTLSGAASGVDSTARGLGTELILRQRRAKKRQPEWHAPWKLRRVVPGHQGWVRCISVDPSNEWFATGSADRTIKIWDLASGTLKLTLTGHISPVRGLDFSSRSPYLFSASEDRTVKCWDLETNRVIRDYYGHLSGVTAVKVHPELDLIVSGGRDGSVRVWDIRTRTAVRMLTGHKHTIGAIELQGSEPQVISSSYDGTIRLWDVVEGRSYATLTHHKKSVRALRIHPTENTFASGSTDAIKAWKLPEPVYMRNMLGPSSVVNGLAFNRTGILVAGSDDGHLHMYDWKTGACFQDIYSTPQSGSLDCEAGILGLEFDMTGTRLITAEADKTIKVYIEDKNATSETHPVPTI